jgi:hypothetical protein
VFDSIEAVRGKEPPPPEVTEYFRKIGKKYGALGGRTSAKNLTAKQRKARASKAGKTNLKALTPEERNARAKKAALARWAKNKPGSGQ